MITQFETGEYAIHRACLAAYQQLKGPVSARVKMAFVTDNKQRFFFKIRCAVGHDIVQTLLVQIAEGDNITKLTQLDAVKNTAAHIA